MPVSPATKYAKAGEVHLAYQIVGEGPIDLVMVTGTPSHVELQWESPPLASLLERLSSFSRLITFDKRGSGLSDSSGGQPTLEERMDDVRAVMDAAGSERAVIFGQSEGSPMSLLFAATYPARTEQLILYGSIVRWVGDDFPGAVDPDQFYPHLNDVVDHWGEGKLADWFAPTITNGPLGPLVRESIGSFERASMSPGSFLHLMRLNAQIDVRPVVPIVAAPTLVMHRTGDTFIGIEQSRWLASNLPNARFIELEGDDHLLAVGDVEVVLEEIEEFVTGQRRTTTRREARPTHSLTESPHGVQPARSMVPSRVLEASVLGPLELYRDGQLVADPVLRRRRVRELFCYLVVHPQTTRSSVASALWPDLEHSAGLDNLRVNLSHLTKLVDPNWEGDGAPRLLCIQGTGLSLAVGSGLRIDADELEQDFDRAVLAEERKELHRALESYGQAIARYRGPYLLDAGDAEWAVWERDRLRGRYVRAATNSGEILLRIGQPEEAGERARRAMAADMWSEPAHLLLVKALTAAGDRLAASRALNDYTELLSELGIEDDQAVAQLTRALASR